MILFFMGVGMTLGFQYINRRFKAGIISWWKSFETKVDEHLKG